MQQPLYLRKLRDFGEKISDSFVFLKGNWKNLLGVYAVFVVPLMIVGTIFGLIFAGRLVGLIQSTTYNLTPTDILSPSLFIIVLCFLLAGSSYSTAMYLYFRIYDANRGIKPSLEQIAKLFFPRFIKIFFYNILLGILLTLVAIIPVLLVIFIPFINLLGIMLLVGLGATVFTHINAIWVSEDVGFSGGFSRLLDLFRNRWWHNIGFTTLIFIIYYVFAFVIQMVFSIFLAIGSMNLLPSPDRTGTGMGEGGVTALVLGIGFMMLLQQVFYIILYCGVGVNYYSLVEEKDGTSIEEQIDSIGTDSDKYGGIEEQY